MTVFTVPLSPQAQSFAISLNGVTYNLTFKWNNDPLGGWIVDIYDANNVLVRGGVPLVTGADLMAQFKYLGFPGALLVQTDHDTDAVPTFTNLGINSNLYFAPTP